MFATRVSLLSIFPFRSRDATRNPGSDVRLLGKMSRSDLTTLLNVFQLRPEVEEWITQICDGYPKLARVLAESAKKETDSLTREKLIVWLSENEIFRDGTRKDKGWVNLILTPDDQEVLGALSLLTEVGYAGHRQKESHVICDFFQIKEDVAERSVQKNLEKGLLTQGSDYVYVTPLILASYLCAYKIGGMRAEKIKEFSAMLQGFPRPQFGKSALEAFTERIKMSSLEEGAQTKLQSVLEHLAPFDQAVLQSEVVAELAFACCHFQPQSFLTSFVRDLRTRSPEEVKTWSEGRRRVVRFLESAAYYPELFDQSAEALFLLANAENETWANNAAGIWSGFFSPGLSGTMAPLPQRAAWLIRLIESGNGSPSLVQRAVESMLTQASSRMTGHENQLGLPIIEVKHGFLINEYHQALTDLVDVIKRHSERLPNLIRVLVDRLRGLTRYGFIQKHIDVVSWLVDQSNNDQVLQQRLLIASEMVLQFESTHLSDEIKSFFEDLRHKLEFETFQNNVRRWSFEPLLGDYKLEKEEKNPLQKLIREIINDPKKIMVAESVLSHPKATRSWFVMYKLGETDKARVLWPYLARWPKGNEQDALVSRYLVGQFYGGADRGWIDDQLDALNEKSNAKDAIADSSKEIETERSFFRLLELANSMPEYIRLLVFGGRASRLSPEEMTRLIDFFRLSKNPMKLSPLWDVLGQYVHSHKTGLPLSEAQIQFLISSLHAPTTGNMTDYYQDEVLKILLDHHINESVAKSLAQSCIEVIIDEQSDYNLCRRCGELLKSLSSEWPDEVFNTVFGFLTANEGHSLFRLENILDDWAEGPFLERLETEAHVADEKTGELIARLMPGSYGALNDIGAILLKRFPSNDAIGSAIVRAFLSGLFSGPIIDRLADQIESLDNWSTQHKLQNDQMVVRLRASLVRELEDTKKSEEEAEFLKKGDR